MFDSGIKPSELIDELKNEIDIAIDIPVSTYVNLLNSVEQLLYSEVIKEQREFLADVSSVIYVDDFEV